MWRCGDVEMWNLEMWRCGDVEFGDVETYQNVIWPFKYKISFFQRYFRVKEVSSYMLSILENFMWYTIERKHAQ
jgi:hypothetical protein